MARRSPMTTIPRASASKIRAEEQTLDHLARIDLSKLGVAEEGTPARERVVKGSRKTKTWLRGETPDGKQFSGVWECTPGAWRVVYDEWEFCHFLSGVSIITEDGKAP